MSLDRFTKWAMTNSVAVVQQLIKLRPPCPICGKQLTLCVPYSGMFDRELTPFLLVCDETLVYSEYKKGNRGSWKRVHAYNKPIGYDHPRMSTIVCNRVWLEIDLWYDDPPKYAEIRYEAVGWKTTYGFSVTWRDVELAIRNNRLPEDFFSRRHLGHLYKVGAVRKRGFPQVIAGGSPEVPQMSHKNAGRIGSTDT